MAFRKGPARGENPGGFRSVLPAGEYGGTAKDNGPRWSTLPMDELAKTAQRQMENLAGQAKRPMIRK
jgi:hypothetical protein